MVGMKRSAAWFWFWHRFYMAPGLMRDVQRRGPRETCSTRWMRCDYIDGMGAGKSSCTAASVEWAIAWTTSKRRSNTVSWEWGTQLVVEGDRSRTTVISLARAECSPSLCSEN